MRIKAQTFILVVLLPLLVACGLATPAGAADWNLSHIWFTPSLTVNADSHCNAILATAKQRFLAPKTSGDDANAQDATFGELTIDTDLNRERQGPDFGNVIPYQSIPLIGGNVSKVFIYFNTNPGCGGACETDNVIISVHPYSGTDDKDSVSTPNSDSWEVYKDSAGKYYLIGEVEDHLNVYQITSPDRWKLSCSVATQPNAAQLNSDPITQTALNSIDNLIATSSGLTRGAGDCGTLQAAGLNRNTMEIALHQILYRPWAMVAERPPPPLTPINPEQSNAAYKEMYSDLEKWSAGGISEWPAFQHYKDQYAVTINALAKFYAEKYGWPAIQSENMAHMALTYAINSGFAFPIYNPYSSTTEFELRKAILGHRPIAEIEAIPLDVAVLNKPQMGDFHVDSVLDVAIEYPEALEYLLKKGLDPNRGNDFGKTPLMYAAQYNQAEAIALLLKAGANPNARTIAPSDTCYYTIVTTSMTPLHYGVRYASGAIVRSLVASGAVPFIEAKNDDLPKGTGEFPLDWLRKYTGKNPHIMANEVPALAELLRVPDGKERSKIASTNIEAAEKSYAGGQPDAAYRSIVIAHSASPNNRRAISDMPLMALKAGRIEEAAEAAANAIRTLKSPSEQASAWFNMGLTCEQSPKRPMGDGTFYRWGIEYNGSSYCYDDPLRNFMRAWQAQPARGRAKKLIQVLSEIAPEDDSRACVVANRQYRFERDDHMDMIYPTEGYREPSSMLGRMYVLRRTGDAIDPSSIKWKSQKENMPAPTSQSPHLVGQYVLGDQTVTVLEAAYSGEPVTVDGQPCGRK